jgi:uncharacterized membrane protein YedE/YeeE
MDVFLVGAGGVALGAVGLGYAATVRRCLGVSGALGGVVGAATARAENAAVGRPLSRLEQLLFLVAIAAGAGLAALVTGTWGLERAAAVGAPAAAALGDGGVVVAVVVGSVLVGVGTQLAQGCTSGHGLMGTARLQVPSLVATAAFFGTAIAVSLGIDAVASLLWSAR